MSQWDEARQSDGVKSELDASRSRAQDDDVTATPTLVVSGPQGTKKLVGAVPSEQVAAAIDEVEAS